MTTKQDNHGDLYQKGESQQPRIDPVITGDTTITGTGIPGRKIIVTLPDGDDNRAG